jgi:hypothetical protein
MGMALEYARSVYPIRKEQGRDVTPGATSLTL